VALNDIMVAKWPKIVANVALSAVETSVNLATQSAAGRLPVSKVTFTATVAAQYGYVAGGPYIDVPANTVITLGAFPPGSAGILYLVAGGAGLADVEIWN
jgi:hypothetical protein